MVSMTLKNIPDELHRRLRERAEAHGRSLNKEILASLEQVAYARRIAVADYLSRVERVHRQIDFQVTFDEIQKAIESGRP